MPPYMEDSYLPTPRGPGVLLSPSDPGVVLVDLSLPAGAAFGGGGMVEPTPAGGTVPLEAPTLPAGGTLEARGSAGAVAIAPQYFAAAPRPNAFLAGDVVAPEEAAAFPTPLPIPLAPSPVRVRPESAERVRLAGTLFGSRLGMTPPMPETTEPTP